MPTVPGGRAHTRLRDLGMLMTALLVALLCGGVAAQTVLRFNMVQIDGGAAESVAVADFNNDGKLDIVSAESWYEAPQWTKRPIRAIPVSSGYVDSFSDLPLDVDGDGFTDVIQIGYFARRIVWMKNPGARRRRVDRAPDRRHRPDRVRVPRRSRQRRREPTTCCRSSPAPPAPR